MERKKEKYNEGKLAIKYRTPVGRLGCPSCGTIVSGAISSPICSWCNENMFEYADKILNTSKKTEAKRGK